MATYEVLEPGGHARLVSDIKGYANRVGGVGTTQIADESVTSAKLADDVTDTLDNVESFTDPMNKNGLHGELAEGTLLTADDVYPMPPRDVDVYGVSTQDGTPTPDAPVEINSVDELTLVLCGKNLANNDKANAGYLTSVGNVTSLANWYHTDLIPVIAGANYYLSGLTANTQQAYFLWRAEDESVVSSHTYNAMKTTPSRVAPANAKYAQISYKADDTALQFELGTTATDYELYVGASVSIPLSDHSLRSLPDGTRDELTLAYIGPSTREGWGVFGVTLASNCWNVNLGELVWSYDTTSGTYPIFKSSSLRDTDYLAATGSAYAPYYLCTTYAIWPTAGNLTNYANRMDDDSIAITSSGTRSIIVVRDDSYSTVEDFVAAVTGEELQYHLLVPFTTEFGTVELPVLPNPLTTWTDGGSAQPTLRMGYERDVNIVISNMMSVIADAATS